MSELKFEPAARTDVGLLIGLAGGTGSGKTVSAMRMAQGIVGRENRFAFIDTEFKRSLHYAPKPGDEPDFKYTFRFDMLEIEAPYRPQKYAQAVAAAKAAGYKAIVVDSESHEWAGYGGVLDWQSEILDEKVKRYMAKYPNSKEYEVIDKMTPSSWIEPKRESKKAFDAILGCSASIPIILCFQAEEKTFGSEGGKLVTFNPPRWAPICNKQFPFWLTVFFMLHGSKPGYPNDVLKLEEQHKDMFPPDKQLDEECGRRIAEWSRGGKIQPSAGMSTSAQIENQPAGDDPFITLDQVIALGDELAQIPSGKSRFLKAAGIKSLELLHVSQHQKALDWIDKVKSTPSA